MTAAGRILVVDDHVALAENIAEILSGAGYETAIADSAESALLRLREGDVAAVITDFRLPGRSGADLIAEMRREGSTIPAVVMSAYTDASTRDVSERAGALEVMAKPIDVAHLLALVERLGEDLDVLIVDDNLSLAENLAEALRLHGLSPIVGSSAEEVLAQCRRPRAAILDFRLPDRDGVQLAQRLTARDPHVRVLFMSGYAADLRAELGEPPRLPYMEKPLDVERLVAWARKAVDDAAERSRR